MTAPVASGWSEFAGWDLHPLENAVLSRRTPLTELLTSVPVSAFSGTAFTGPRRSLVSAWAMTWRPASTPGLSSALEASLGTLIKGYTAATSAISVELRWYKTYLRSRLRAW